MSKLIHLIYLTLIALSFFIGNHNAEKSQTGMLASTCTDQITTVTADVERQATLLSRATPTVLFQKRESSTSDAAKDVEIDAHEEQINALAQQDTAKLLFYKLAALQGEFIEPSLIGTPEFFASVENELLYGIYEDERIELIEQYLFEFRRNASDAFIDTLFEQSDFMTLNEQQELLNVMVYQAKASKGAENSEYHDAIVAGASQFLESENQALRFSAIKILSQHQNQSLAKEKLKTFSNDESDLVRAYIALHLNENPS